MPDYTGMTVAEILKQKRAAIKQAALEPGSPSWDEILDVPWEEVIARANRGEPGYRTIKKLLTRRRFSK